jgi:hypothetical protein
MKIRERKHRYGGQYAAGASAAKVNSTKRVAQILGEELVLTGKPNEDFENVVLKIPRLRDRTALKWYKLGVKRGLILGTDLVANGTIRHEGGVLYAPKTIVANVRTRIAGGPLESRQLKFTASSIGFK